MGYRFISEYKDSFPTRKMKEFMDYMSRNSMHACDAQYMLKTHQYVLDTNEAFVGSKFLSLLSNKTLAILGDSLGEQLFNAIDAELSPHMNTNKSMSPGNGTHSFSGFYFQNQPDMDQFPRVKAAYRYYDNYNAQILWCKDFKLLSFNEEAFEWMNDFCRRRAFTSDILILSLGAHFKPPSYTRSMEEYEKYLDLQARLLEAHLLSLRQHLFRLNGKRQLVLWRLNAHAGGIDEYNAMYSNPLSLKNPHPNIHFLYPENRPSHHYEHNSLPLWDDLTLREASWVTRFNRVVRVVSDLHKDYVLDHYSISMDLLKREKDRLSFQGIANQQQQHSQQPQSKESQSQPISPISSSPPLQSSSFHVTPKQVSSTTSSLPPPSPPPPPPRSTSSFKIDSTSKLKPQINHNHFFYPFRKLTQEADPSSSTTNRRKDLSSFSQSSSTIYSSISVLKPSSVQPKQLADLNPKPLPQIQSNPHPHHFPPQQQHQHQLDSMYYTHPSPIPIHSDSMHYCAGGLFRAAVLQLYKAIEHTQTCRFLKD